MNRKLVTATCGVIGAGAIALGMAAPAQALSDVDRAVKATCSTLDQVPSVGGVAGTVRGMTNAGFTAKERGEILGLAVTAGCPEHAEIIYRYVALAT